MSDKLAEYALDTEGVTPRALTAQETADILAMLDTPGWKVFVELKGIEAKTSSDIALSLQAPEPERDRHRAVYHGLMATITFENMFKDAVAKLESEA